MATADQSKVAVSVSKKVSKMANLRNRTRRRAYAAIEKVIDSLPNKHFLVIAKPGAEKLQGQAILSELAGLLKKG